MSHHSFIILAYKESPYLRDCIRSLLDQSVQSEIVICTSTPGAHIKNIAAEFQLPLHINPEAKGIAADWNFALHTANSPFVTLAHQDDLYHEAFTASCLSAFKKNPTALICFTDYTELENEQVRGIGTMLRVKRLMLSFFMPFHRIRSVFWKKRMLSIGNPIAAPGVMYNKRVLGDFQFDENFIVSLDWEAWLRLAALHGDFLYINQPLLQHRIHTASATTSAIESALRSKEDRMLFNKLWPKPLAELLAGLYAYSYKSNRVRSSTK